MTGPDHSSDGDVSARLRSLRVDVEDGGFREGLHRALAQRPVPAPLSPFARLVLAVRSAAIPWPAAAALGAAAAVAVALVVRQVAPVADPDEVIATGRVPTTKVAVVRLELSADVAVAEADIRVSLPDGLSFWSRGEALPERSFEWTQPLVAGRNEIPIAVHGARPGRYHVAVTARVGDEWIVHDVPLLVTEG
jgi:hypothetical protein